MRNPAFLPIDFSARHMGDEGVRSEQANPIGTRYNDILIGIETADDVTVTWTLAIGPG